MATKQDVLIVLLIEGMIVMGIKLGRRFARVILYVGMELLKRVNNVITAIS